MNCQAVDHFPTIGLLYVPCPRTAAPDDSVCIRHAHQASDACAWLDQRWLGARAEGATRWEVEELAREQARRTQAERAREEVKSWDDGDGTPYGLATIRNARDEFFSDVAAGMSRNRALRNLAYKCGRAIGSGDVLESYGRSQPGKTNEALASPLPRSEAESVIARGLAAGERNPLSPREEQGSGRRRSSRPRRRPR